MHWVWWPPIVGLLTFFACAPAGGEARQEAETSPTPPPTQIAGPTPESAALTPTVLAQDPVQELEDAGINTRYWKTDFKKHNVLLTEIMPGGPPKDGIPAIDTPKLVAVAAADAWLEEAEPVQVLSLNGEARAYPLQILIWHEIVNDVVAGTPVAITYCPLCNTAITFDTRLDDGRVLTFGTTGNLRFSDLIMYDRETESWWQQITGEAIVGELAGKKLKVIPSSVVAWREFKRAYPDGTVFSRETGYERDYGSNPYVGYDSGQPFLYHGPQDKRLPAIERVVTVDINGEAIALPFSALEREPVVQMTVGGRGVVVFYRKGTASALDTEPIARGRDIGATGVFDSVADGRRLTFQLDGVLFKDQETGSHWNLLGQAIDGPLRGSRLTPIVHGNHFWFSWVVFKPNTKVYVGKDREI